MSVVEDSFITRDIDKTFNMIEDESGDLFWGYGHRDGPEFIEEVNRWLIHACGATVPDDLFPSSERVEHLWAKFDDQYREHFTLVEPTCTEADAHIFAVTRLWA